MEKLTFVDHPIVTKDRESYTDIVIDTELAIKSYRLSLMSFEMLDEDGVPKPDEAVDENEQRFRQNIRAQMTNNEPLEKPIVGIGLQDNFEIAVGRSIFMVLALEGHAEIPVHVRNNQVDDLKDFIKN